MWRSTVFFTINIGESKSFSEIELGFQIIRTMCKEDTRFYFALFLNRVLKLSGMWAFFCLSTPVDAQNPYTPQPGNPLPNPTPQGITPGGQNRKHIEETNRQQMQLFGNQPPPSQEDIRKAQQRQIEGKPPELSPREKMEKEMVELLWETQYNSAVANSKGYYNSQTYLMDVSDYIQARDRIRKMLYDSIPLSIKDAYYFSEAAYGTLHLTYGEYIALIESNENFIKQWLTQNRYSLTDPEALHLGIQKFMSDTLYAVINGTRQGHIPYYYDYIDATSAGDRRNYFVTKTLATGSGQCHTFPVTYLILAEALGVEAHLAYNPMHSFIRYANNAGTVVNYETTVDRFLPDAFYLETLPVMEEAYRNDLYVTDLSKKQVVASVLFDLAVNFIQEHWLGDQTFIRECMEIAMPYFPNQGFVNTASNYLHKRLYADAFNSKVQEKGIRNINDIPKYPDVYEAYTNYYGYMERVQALGIQDFPEAEYLRMLEYYDEKSRLQIARNVKAKEKRPLFIN